ncbi:hypothetical protein R3P38DRAFT_1237382 [Favolaschia claudopus]|uniref:Uncharacterized protein n=1 Tax=Favolaschia claudopus TaxID=2862362 RepID=A0AAW0B3G0_9AGAR
MNQIWGIFRTQSSVNSSPNGAATLKFTNLLSRLLDQPVLSRKHASILFLHSLPPMSTNRVNIVRATPSSNPHHATQRTPPLPPADSASPRSAFPRCPIRSSPRHVRRVIRHSTPQRRLLPTPAFPSIPPTPLTL